MIDIKTPKKLMCDAVLVLITLPQWSQECSVIYGYITAFSHNG